MRYRIAQKLQLFLSITLSFSLPLMGLICLSLQTTRAVGTNMMILWDGSDASIPAGWTKVSTYDGKFPRGESVANFAGTGGSSSITPGISSTVVNTESSSSSSGGLALTNRAIAAHTHTVSGQSVSSANSNNWMPSYHSLKLIAYSGIPETIPSGGIVMFDGTPGMPATNWSQYTAMNGKMLLINSSVTPADGGNDTKTFTITWGAIGASTGQTTIGTGGGNVTSANGHTHTAPAQTTTTDTTLPDHVQPVFAQATVDTVVPGGMIAMFDGDPGAGWQIQSNSGGTFFQKFARGASSYSASCASACGATFSLPAATSGVSGTSGAVSGNSATAGTMSGANHTHTETMNFTAGTSNVPPYVNMVFGQKIGFTLNDYRWFYDNGSENVSTAWGNPAISESGPITTIPAPSDPPSMARQLRLRLNLAVSGPNLPASNMQFKLQYKQGTDASCTAGSWTDVGAVASGSTWRYANSSIADATTLTASHLSPASDTLQKYAKSNPTAVNPASASTGQTMEYDFHLEDNGATGATKYSFRVVESTGYLINDYAVCPTLTTGPNTSDVMRHGDFFENESRKGFFWAN